jgi:NTE family protein
MERKRLGLALGGGGARGFAHIGVLKIFEQEHIPVDFLSGSSMGGVLAAAYGAGVSPEKLEAVALDFSNPRKMMRLMDVNPLRRGLLEGKRLRAYLIDQLGLDLQFDQLKIPVALTATDCLRGETVVLNTGSVIDAVMATCAFPGIFHAVKIADRWLLDGGMLNNVPVSVVKMLGAQVVIAIDVTSPIRVPEIPEDLEQVHHLPPIFPRLTEDIYQASMIMTNEMTRIRLKECPPDLVINPQISDDISIFLGFFQASKIIAAGETTARQLLPNINQLVAKAHDS